MQFADLVNNCYTVCVALMTYSPVTVFLRQQPKQASAARRSSMGMPMPRTRPSIRSRLSLLLLLLFTLSLSAKFEIQMLFDTDFFCKVTTTRHFYRLCFIACSMRNHSSLIYTHLIHMIVFHPHQWCHCTHTCSLHKC